MLDSRALHATPEVMKIAVLGGSGMSGPPHTLLVLAVSCANLIYGACTNVMRPDNTTISVLNRRRRG